MKSTITNKDFWIGAAAAVAVWYIMQYMRARKATSS